jgi:hypothetical protein
MQISGPWPPYHFVQRLTRGIHPHQHPAAAVQAQEAAPAAAPVVQILEPVPAMA